MHPFIASENDLEKYKLLDEVVHDLVQIHNSLRVPLTFAVLTSTLLYSLDQFYQLTFSSRELYPRSSLVHRLFNDTSFFQLVILHSPLFFKGRFLIPLLNSSSNLFCKVSSHSFSHLHLHEELVTPDIMNNEIQLSMSQLRTSFRPSLLRQSYVSPRNQLTRELVQILKSNDINTLRVSSSNLFLSENHGFSFLASSFFRSLRFISHRYPLRFQSLLFKLCSHYPSFLLESGLSLIDSGALIPFKSTNSFSPRSFLPSHSFLCRSSSSKQFANLSLVSSS